MRGRVSRTEAKVENELSSDVHFSPPDRECRVSSCLMILQPCLPLPLCTGAVQTTRCD